MSKVKPKSSRLLKLGYAVVLIVSVITYSFIVSRPPHVQVRDIGILSKYCGKIVELDGVVVIESVSSKSYRMGDETGSAVILLNPDKERAAFNGGQPPVNRKLNILVDVDCSLSNGPDPRTVERNRTVR